MAETTPGKSRILIILVSLLFMYAVCWGLDALLHDEDIEDIVIRPKAVQEGAYGIIPLVNAATYEITEYELLNTEISREQIGGLYAWNKPVLDSVQVWRIEDCGPWRWTDGLIFWFDKREYGVRNLHYWDATFEGSNLNTMTVADIESRIYASNTKLYLMVLFVFLGLVGMYVLYAILAFSKVHKKNGIYTFNKPFAAELFKTTALTGAAVLCVFTVLYGSTYRVSMFGYVISQPDYQSDLSLMDSDWMYWASVVTLSITALILIFYAWKELYNAGDYVQISPESVEIRNSGNKPVLSIFSRDRILHIEVVEEKSGRSTSWVLEINGERFPLANMNLSGFGSQLKEVVETEFPAVKPASDASGS